MLVLQHMLLTQLLPHLTTSRTIRRQQLQVLIIKHSNHHHIMQPHLQRPYTRLTPRIADLLPEDIMARNDLLFLTNQLLLLLVEVVVVAISPIYLGRLRAAAEVGRWSLNVKLPYPALKLLSHPGQ